MRKCICKWKCICLKLPMTLARFKFLAMTSKIHVFWPGSHNITWPLHVIHIWPLYGIVVPSDPSQIHVFGHDHYMLSIYDHNHIWPLYGIVPSDPSQIHVFGHDHYMIFIYDHNHVWPLYGIVPSDPSQIHVFCHAHNPLTHFWR